MKLIEILFIIGSINILLSLLNYFLEQKILYLYIIVILILFNIGLVHLILQNYSIMRNKI